MSPEYRPPANCSEHRWLLVEFVFGCWWECDDCGEQRP